MQRYRRVAVTAAGAKPLIQVLTTKVVDEHSVARGQLAILEQHADLRIRLEPGNSDVGSGQRLSIGAQTARPNGRFARLCIAQGAAAPFHLPAVVQKCHAVDLLAVGAKLVE